MCGGYRRLLRGEARACCGDGMDVPAKMKNAGTMCVGVYREFVRGCFDGRVECKLSIYHQMRWVIFVKQVYFQ